MFRDFFSAGPLDHGPAESPEVQRKTAGRILCVSQTKGCGADSANFGGDGAKCAAELES